MQRNALSRSLLCAFACATMVPAAASAAPKSHRTVIQSVANMVSNSGAQTNARKHGLQLLNVMWEDTGRFVGSSVGPNISDVTIEVEFEDKDSKKQTRLMPVLRFPNFTDKTGDIDIDKFFVRVGNESEQSRAHSVSLRELLGHPGRYMSLPKNGKIKGDSLLAKRDDKVLVSAQSAFLPIRKGGKTRFWPVIFNYQSYAKNPAVLTILVTRQGTSMTIVDNSRDVPSGGGSWGQRLYFNDAGQRAPLTAERLKDVQSSGVTMNGESADSLGKDSNLLMMIQVPLKHKAQGRGGWGFGIGSGKGGGGEGAPSAAYSSTVDSVEMNEAPDVDLAVLGHGPSMGPFTELDDLTIERDERFPVRVTVQFYQATSNGVVGAADLKRMADQISKVYKQADYVGSLVLPEGEDRPTMWTGATTAPAHLTWRDFAGLRERYAKFGWAGLVNRSDLHAGINESSRNIGVTLIAESCAAALGPLFQR